MGNGRWYAITEEERPFYLMRRAEAVARDCGIGAAQAAETLCALWGWDPKKYLRKGSMDAADTPGQ